MKKFFLILMFLITCTSAKSQEKEKQSINGVYIVKQDKLYRSLSDNNYSSLEIRKDGTYILNKDEVVFTPVVEQCDNASKGKWSRLADNILEITSEDYGMRQKGFEYVMKKENKFSQDSLYINVVFPTDFHPVTISYTFNYNNSKSVVTNKEYIVVPKSKYLWNRKIAVNNIKFDLNADVAGIEMYKSRILFKIFEESIDTEKHNFLTIILSHFDRCFFEFEPYYQELIYVKDQNQLFWKGEIWIKKEEI